MTNADNPTIVKEVFITSFFSFEVGKYLIRPLSKPRILKLEIKVIIEIRVVPIPTCSGVNNLAFMIQKKKPKKAMTAVLAIR